MREYCVKPMSFLQESQRTNSQRTRSNSGRSWNGYSAYNPAQVGKLLDIFRVVHNYVDTRKKKGEEPTTAAMRLGLAKAPTDYKDILYYEQ